MEGFLNINGHRLHYVEYGSGKPVFSIHGYVVDHRMMTGCLEPVFEQTEGYRRIYVDLPGMGQTPGEGLRCADDWLELLDGAVEQLIGKEHFLIAGQSYGCYLELGLICRRNAQIDGALFIGPCTIAKRPPRQLPVKSVVEEDRAFAASMPAGDYKLLTDWSVVVDKRTWRIFERDMACGIRLEDQAYTHWIEKNGYELSLEKEFLNIKFDRPSCWVTARQDFFVGYKDAYRFMDNFSRATFVCFDGAGHNMHIEKEDQFLLLVRDWLHRIDKLQPFTYDPDWVAYPDNQ